MKILGSAVLANLETQRITKKMPCVAINIGKYFLTNIVKTLDPPLHMTYGCQIWGQKGNENRNKISTLQNKMLKRIHFKPNDETVNPLYHKSNILKFNDYVILQNFLFDYDHSHKTLPLILQNICVPVTNIH